MQRPHVKRSPRIDRRSALGALAGFACLPASQTARGLETRPRNADLLRLAGGRWIKIHEQRPGDATTFKRQAHGGSAFDSRRGRLVLFGSDTHGKDWSNSPRFFDLASLSWSQLYPDDDKATYRVNAQSLPVAGPKGDHPWAMHSFGAVAYDSERDELIVASYPKHMEPGRFSDALAHVWPQVKRHPTWILRMESGLWQPLESDAVHFFPYCAAFDSDRGVLIGYARYGVYELSGAPRSWRRLAERGLTGYHNNAVFDSGQGAVVVFGSQENSNDIVIFEPGGGRHQTMPTSGPRPPKDQTAPMAYHPGLERSVVLVDRERRLAETWSYDLATDRWTQHSEADLPFPLGMNYNMEYDARHDLLLLVTETPGRGATSVWALRL